MLRVSVSPGLTRHLGAGDLLLVDEDAERHLGVGPAVVDDARRQDERQAGDGPVAPRGVADDGDGCRPTAVGPTLTTVNEVPSGMSLSSPWFLASFHEFAWQSVKT